MFGLNYFNALPNIVRDELGQLVEGLKGYVLNQHNDDGSHGNVTASGNVVAQGYATFAGQYRCMLRPSANIVLTTGLSQAITWSKPIIDGSEEGGYDIGGFWDSNNPTFISPPVDGVYLLTFNVRFENNATGVRLVEPTMIGGGVQVDNGGVSIVGDTVTNNDCARAMVIPMRYGQRVYMTAFQNSGGNLNITASSFGETWCQLTKIA